MSPGHSNLLEHTLSTLRVMLTQKWALTTIEKVARSKMDDLMSCVKMTNVSTTHVNLNRKFQISHQHTGHNSHHLDCETPATVFIPLLPSARDRLPTPKDERRVFEESS